MIVHVKQPTLTSCAQACIAMVTGVDVLGLIVRMRPGNAGTRGPDIVRELRAWGIDCDDRFVSLRGRPFPDFGIVRIVHANDIGHVVVKDGSTWHDPLLDRPFEGNPPRFRVGKLRGFAAPETVRLGSVIPWCGVAGSRITSALSIRRRVT